jgi:multiple sugar transport system substrate-binding protein
MRQNKFRILLGLVLLAVSLTFSGCGRKQVVEKYKVDLEIWGVMDDSDAYREIFENYRDLNPNVGKITYKKQRIETYEKDLIDALASGNGPDIFLIHNTWLSAFSNKISPAPKEILTEQEFHKNFIDVAAEDFISEGKIFAVPLSVSSLALYYNKDLFNAEGIAEPPKTWDEFLAVTEKITKVDMMGEINPSGAALGTAKNINRSTDILTMLMLQNGVQMRDKSGRVDFGKNEKAQKALEFYTNFAKNSAPNYSWNSRMHYSVDAFSEGTLAMMINYPWQIEAIRSKAPKLNFAIAEVPQMLPASPANYANYWGYTVSGNKIITPDPKSKTKPITNDLRLKEAWNFLAYLTTNNNGQVAPTSATAVVKKAPTGFDPAENYLEKTNQVAARRDLIEKQKSDLYLGVFAKGNLVAKNWLQKNPLAIETIFADMIDDVNRGAASIAEALSSATEKIKMAETE